MSASRAPSGEFPQLREIAAGKGLFLGVGPAFELAFALERGWAVGENFGVDQLDRWRICGRFAAGTAAVLGEASGQVAGGTDVEMTVLQAEDVDGIHRWKANDR